jgi:F-type H+-transporting ATPase subunit epsilon
VVVTPERTVLDERAEFIALPLYDGELGILPGRAPLIARLGAGELRIAYNDTGHRAFIDGGFVQVRDNEVTVLTQRALEAVSITGEMAQRELQAAQSQRACSGPEIEARQAAADRARALARVAAKR